MRIRRSKAISQGYKVDDHCYPPRAYKGPSFEPTAIVETHTELEAELLKALRKIASYTYDKHAMMIAQKAINDATG